MAKDNWSDKEVALLKKRRSQGKGWLEIANEMGRTSDSVRMKWRSLFGEVGTSGKLKDPIYISSNLPRVGLFDVETLPMDVMVWRLFDENVGINQVISGTGLLGWAGKFLNEPDMHSDILTPEEALGKDDQRITNSCWHFLKACDVVVGHNLAEFDSKVANTFFLKYGLPPLKYVQIDTLKIARRNFRFDSNRLGFINRLFGIREKIENEGFPLWRACREGDADALRRMQEYNEGDIYALEDLYYKLRPYMPHVFNVALYDEIETRRCPVCGNAELKDEGYYYTPSGKWSSYRCTNCQCLFRGKTNLLSKEKRKLLGVNS